MIEQKKKIFLAITKANWGGAQRYVYDLATSLPKDLYEVSVLLGTDGTLAQKLQYQGIRTIILGGLSRDISLFEDFVSFIKIRKILKKEKPDVLHLNSSKMGLIGALAGRLAHVPKIIFTGHGWAFNEERRSWQKKIIFWLHQLTIILVHQTIAVSNQTKNQIAKKGFLSKKIIVVKNGLDDINYFDRAIARKKIQERLPTDSRVDKRPWLITISELHENKGLKYAIEAIHQIKIASKVTQTPQPVFIIIGEGEKRKDLEQQIKDNDLSSNVFLLGRIDDAAKYLKASDIFILASITEALPYVILEAGGAGLPIIASDVGGIPEIINDMENGILVRPKEPNEIRKAIEYCLNNPQKIDSFGEKIKEKVKIEFNKEIMIKKTIALY